MQGGTHQCVALERMPGGWRAGSCTRPGTPPATLLCWRLARGCHHGSVWETVARHHPEVHEVITPQQFALAHSGRYG